MQIGWVLKYVDRTEKIFNSPFLYKRFFTHLVRQQIKRIKKNGPSTVLIEGTNMCNAKCITCPHKYMSRSVGIMDMALYKKIVDECKGLGVYSVHPYGFGEPLLDPFLVERIRYAKSQSIRYVPIFSNFSQIDEDKISDLIDSGLDEITVGFEGADKETFEQVRIGINFDDVNSNIVKFLLIRDHLRRKNPLLNLFITRRKGNEKAVSCVYRRWKNKVNEVFVWPASNWTGATDEICSSRPRIVFPCFALWDSVVIRWNGNVVLCSSDYDDFCILGNVRKSSIREIWSSEKLEEIRREHLSGRGQNVELCRRCRQITFGWPRWFMRAFSQMTGDNLDILKK
ncbi:MAG: hypothetical protein FJZ15_06525 [Candidatus Omnitrophica bacterium]|nr:hypothetical protein [Candidatus Omnitrophota bacterium]